MKRALLILTLLLLAHPVWAEEPIPDPYIWTHYLPVIQVIEE